MLNRAIAVLAGSLAAAALLAGPIGEGAGPARPLALPNAEAGGPGRKTSSAPRAKRVPHSPTSRPAPQAVPPAQEKEVLDYVAKHHPDLAERLARTRRSDPHMYQGVIRRIWSFLRFRKNLPPQIAQAYERLHTAVMRMWQVAHDLQETTDPTQRADLGQQLQQLAAEHFEMDQLIREHKLAVLEKQLQDLRATLKQRQANRDQIIKDTVRRTLDAARKRQAPKLGARPGGEVLGALPAAASGT